jgi:hypothetical protein
VADLFLAIPTHGETVVAEFAASLMRLSRALVQRRIPHGVKRIDNSLIPWSRNELVRVFLATNSTHLLFLDSEVEFPAEGILSMIDSGHDLCSGTYAFKDGSGAPVDGGAGLLLISRSLLNRMIEAHPELKYRLDVRRDDWGHDLFGCLIHPDTHVLMSEDKSFLYRAAQLGVVPKIFEYPTRHWGMKAFEKK